MGRHTKKTPDALSLEEAQEIAQQENLWLVTSTGKSGFAGVKKAISGNTPYNSYSKVLGSYHHIGSFQTVASAALAYARFLGPERCAAARVAAEEAAELAAKESGTEPMTKEDADRLAAEEGISLIPANNAIGLKGVTPSSCIGRPFKVDVKEDGKAKHLGSYRSEWEAALVHARWMGPERCAELMKLVAESERMAVATAAAAAAAAAAGDVMTVEEAERMAKEQDLLLIPADNETGYKNVIPSSCGQYFKVSGRPAWNPSLLTKHPAPHPQLPCCSCVHRLR